MGVAFGPDDQFAQNGTVLAERPPLKGSVNFDYAMLELDRNALLEQKFVVTNLIVERPQVQLRIFEDGTTSLDKLLLPRKSGSGTSGDSSEQTEPKEKTRNLFSAKNLPISAVAERMAIEDATIFATVEKSKTTVQIHKGVIILRDIDIDPNALAEHNAANMEFSANVAVDSFLHDMRYLDIAMEGTGAVQPFNVDTAQLEPSLSANVTVRKDSWIDALALLDEMEDLIAELQEYGMNLENVRLRGDFSEDTTAGFNVTREELTMTSDFMIPIDENFIVLEEGSRVDAGKKRSRILRHLHRL